MPLREVLKILEGEGQVTYVAQRGYFVALLSPTCRLGHSPPPLGG